MRLRGSGALVARLNLRRSSVAFLADGQIEVLPFLCSEVRAQCWFGRCHGARTQCTLSGDRTAAQSYRFRSQHMPRSQAG